MGAAAKNILAAIFTDEDPIVSKDPVKVKDDKTDLPQQLFKGRSVKTTPTLSHGSSLRSSKEMFSSSRRGRTVTFPISRSISYGASPSLGDLMAISSRVRARPAGRSRAATSFFAILNRGFSSDG